jgi:hypothetical protein
MSLKELESWIERGQNITFLREKRPPKNYTPNIGADIGAITGILLISSGKFITLTAKKNVLNQITYTVCTQNLLHFSHFSENSQQHHYAADASVYLVYIKRQIYYAHRKKNMF